MIDETTQIKIGVNSLLGSSNSSGTNVVVTCLLTGSTENLSSQYDTANFIRTTGLLGQSSVSTTLSDYECLLPNKLINDSALGAPESAFNASLVGVTGEDKAAEKIAAAVDAWWAELQANPSTYFSSASAIIPPTTLSSLENDLQSAFDANNDFIEANGNITNDQALDTVANALMAGTLGGILEESGTPPKQFSIE